MPSEARQKKIMEKLNRAKMLNFGASKPRVKGGWPPGAPWIRTCKPQRRDSNTGTIDESKYIQCKV